MTHETKIFEFFGVVGVLSAATANTCSVGRHFLACRKVDTGLHSLKKRFPQKPHPRDESRELKGTGVKSTE
jgi:hypothetical protein